MLPSTVPEGEGRRRRQTPGLRREEVALRAGISVDWYTRIELGTGVVPSVATLQAIGGALHLDPVDTQYLFQLAELPVPHMDAPLASAASPALEAMVLQATGVAAFVHDVYSTPLCWNAAADALFRISGRADDFERNLIVAGLKDPYYASFFGDDWEAVSRRAIGMFRRAYTTVPPSSLAQQVYAYGMETAWFRKFWDEHSVAEEYTPPGPFVRHVPGLGSLTLDFNDLAPLHSDQVLRILAPHDATTRAAFAALGRLGRARGFTPGA